MELDLVCFKEITYRRFVYMFVNIVVNLYVFFLLCYYFKVNEGFNFVFFLVCVQDFIIGMFCL